MTTPPLTRQNCAACGLALRRVPRTPQDTTLKEHRRYRCVSPECGWEALLPRMPSRQRVRRLASAEMSATSRLQRRRLRIFAVSTLLMLVLAAALATGVRLAFKERPVELAMAPGEHHDGLPLPPTHPLLVHFQRASYTLPSLPVPALNDGVGAAATAGPLASAAATAGPLASATSAATPPVTAASKPVPRVVGLPPPDQQLALRRACVWGKPGRDPYRGTVEQALNMATLPPEVVREIARQVKAGAPADELVIANDGIRAVGSGRKFNPQNVAMTYGKTLCLGTRVNFVAGHTEPAALYEAADHAGRIYAVMVPPVCGNVSVLGQADEQDPRTDIASGAADEGDADKTAAGATGSALSRGAQAAAHRSLPALLEWGSRGRATALDGSSHDVPLPGSLLLVLTALGLLWHRQRRR